MLSIKLADLSAVYIDRFGVPLRCCLILLLKRRSLQKTQSLALTLMALLLLRALYLFSTSTADASLLFII